MTESLLQKQVRLMHEAECRAAADVLKRSLPAGTGFILVTFDLGEGDSVRYVSNAQRAGCVEVLRDLFEQWEHEEGGTDGE